MYNDLLISGEFSVAGRKDVNALFESRFRDFIKILVGGNFFAINNSAAQVLKSQGGSFGKQALQFYLTIFGAARVRK